jgi:predicted amidohydrolase
LRAAVVQLNSGDDVERNVETAERLVRAAAADGAELIALPEKWNLLGSGEALQAGAEPLDGPTLSAARAWARELEIYLLCGSIAERAEGEEQLFNTSVLVGPDGADLATYRKIHMFDVEVGGVHYRESERERGGGEIAIATIADGVQLGLTVCYDLRFPELYRILAVRGARVIAVPSAFTFPTGRAHWEVLLRARAIENQCYVVAAGQIGDHEPARTCFGRSMIIDPWGIVLAQAPDTVGIVTADLDVGRLEEIRRELPSLANRRL